MLKFLDKNNQLLDIKTWTMPDGAPHCNINNNVVSGITIHASITSFNVFGELLCALDALSDSVKEIVFKYLPLRQDRRQENFPFTVLVYAKALASLYSGDITFVHPHNEENTKRIFPNAKFIYPNFIEQAIAKSNPDAIIIPDKGAKVLVEKLNLEQYGIEIIYCEKTRDSLTGQLSNPIIHGDVTGKDLLIVDDICDGGYTFIQLAEECSKQGCNYINLYTTHGIYSKGFNELNIWFDNIFCTNTFERLKYPQDKDHKLTRFNLN
jgi:ribose-phosphate pyrophosphokinase